ncbi:hypothetical protein [Chondromyces apiculatus]|uniref:Tat (Twin-arginine translocation) pathway signal sequence domain protein n=1 Tax=Chondromyces apiculatus DSM 436 TaxID=1192034 RepID=A0A017TJ28_9BACT|nr:hypothetical protein [Chondromyces apiculatus]EYF08850.1 Hypothetical protein CAP_2711 [Chondromyces apiculatus DSM 436]
MVCDKTKNLQGESRRTFLKLTTAFGAAIGLDQAGILNAIADVGGSALAQSAKAPTKKSIHLIAGNGGFAWFNLLWPHRDIAMSGNNNFSYHRMGQVQEGDTDEPSAVGPDTPFVGMGRNKQVSIFGCGVNQTHTQNPNQVSVVAPNRTMMASVASMQMVNSSLVPVIGIEPVNFGTAPGAPAITTVQDPGGMVELFNSAASQYALQASQDAVLFESTYKAQVNLLKAANRQTFHKSLDLGRSASNFLGQNLRDKLAPTQDDLARYEINGNTENKMRRIAQTFITASKAFKLGLTQSVIVQVMSDDPHGAFGNMTRLNETARLLKLYFEMLDKDLDVANSESGGKFNEEYVVTVHGDTPKDARQRDGWPDGTSNNSNWMYVLGNGRLRTGGFMRYPTQGNAVASNPVTGKIDNNRNTASCTAAANAAVLYAISGDMRLVRNYYQADEGIDGYIRPDLDG